MLYQLTYDNDDELVFSHDSIPGNIILQIEHFQPIK